MITIPAALASKLSRIRDETGLSEEQKLRFLSRIILPDENGCAMWGGRRDEHGGQLKINGKGTPAHRVAFQIAHGPIPPGMQVRHTCNHALCMTPAHLYAAPPPVKAVKEPKPPRKKLSDDDIQTIRTLRCEGKTLAEIALLFHVTPPTIYNACKGITRQRVPFLPEHAPKQLP